MTKPFTPTILRPLDNMDHQERLLVEETIVRLLAERCAAKSICPSEVARRLDRLAWRERLNDVRDVAQALAARGQIEITQGGRRIDHPAPRGPIRLRLPRPA